LQDDMIWPSVLVIWSDSLLCCPFISVSRSRLLWFHCALGSAFGLYSSHGERNSLVGCEMCGSVGVDDSFVVGRQGAGQKCLWEKMCARLALVEWDHVRLNPSRIAWVVVEIGKGVARCTVTQANRSVGVHGQFAPWRHGLGTKCPWQEVFVGLALVEWDHVRFNRLRVGWDMGARTDRRRDLCVFVNKQC
jgi:hypothetical protein